MMQRLLQDTSNEHMEHDRARTILTILYLCVLAMCFVVPVVFYIKLCQLHRTRMRLMQQQQQSMASPPLTIEQQRETEALQRKLMEHRRARLLQLFLPVQVVRCRKRLSLLIVTFRDMHMYSRPYTQHESHCDCFEQLYLQTLREEHFVDFHNHHSTDEDDDTTNDVESGSTQKDTTQHSSSHHKAPFLVPTTTGDNHSILTDVDDCPMICIPSPGISVHLPPGAMQTTRHVPGVCSICLSMYRIGSQVVWSSNPLCEHVFHVACMTPWILKHPHQGPNCPCCRQEFVLDAFLLPNDANDEEEGAMSNVRHETMSVRWMHQHATASELQE
jgi:hypothetical protein